MPNTETEIEYKFAAPHVRSEDLTNWLMWYKDVGYKDVGYLNISAPDNYYGREGSDHVVRHRLSGGAGELTVKTRTSAESTLVRGEIDLHFSEETTADEVAHFLEATGWQHEFTVNKNADIWWLKHNQIPICLSLYDVWREEADGKKTKPRRFLEVEVEKGNDITEEQAKGALDNWKRILQDKFFLAEPLTLSLYELYSGRKYRVT